MPVIRVYNPRKRRKSKARRSGGKRKKHNIRRRRKNVRRSRPKRNPGAGTLLVMGNPRRKRRNKHGRKRNVRRRNPRHVAASSRHYRRRRNPLGISKETLSLAVYGAAGAVAVRAGTQAILGDKNAGAVGYVGNAVAAVILSFAGGRFISPAAGTGLLVGGLIGLVLRVAKEQVFASSPLAAQLQLQGMGDADFALSGYVTDPFALPTTSEGPDQLTVTPNKYWERPVIVNAKGMQGYDSGYLGGRGAQVVDRWKTPWG